MQGRWGIAAWGLGLSLVACGGDDGGDDGVVTFGPGTTGPSGTTGATAMTTAEPGSTGAGPGSGDGAPGTTSGSPGSTSAEPGSSGDTMSPADSSAGEGGGNLCEQPQANACLDCAVPSCCQAWTNCQADEGCTCVVQCHVVEGGSLGSCESQCDSDGELYQALFFCGQQSCLGTCDWDCC